VHQNVFSNLGACISFPSDSQQKECFSSFSSLRQKPQTLLINGEKNFLKLLFFAEALTLLKMIGRLQLRKLNQRNKLVRGKKREREIGVSVRKRV